MKKWILTLMLIVFAARAGAYSIPYESWMGTFIGEKKVGWMSINVEKSEYEGGAGYKVTSVVSNHLTVLGADMTQVVDTVVYTDAKYAPLKESFSMTSGGKTTSVVGKFTKSSIECDVSAGSGTSKKSIPIPDGAQIIADPLFTTTDTFPPAGTEIDLRYFNPLTLSLDTVKITVGKREKITVDGKSFDTILLTNSTPMGDMDVWQEADGSVVKVKGMMGISMVRMSKAAAVADVDGGKADDFAVLTSAKCDRTIADPRDVKSLKAILTGIDSNMLISDARQTATPVKDKPGCARYSINVGKFDRAKSAKLPVTESALHEYLVATPYVDSDATEIINQTRETVGSEKNAYAACSKIRAWVYGNLKVKSDIGITRSGSDVLKSKVGVCRDYAILFASLARAAGIPSKVVSGLIYTDGAFYYHAWVECYVGKWIPFDATLPSDFVDATHVKLAEGDATTMFSLAKVIGSLKVEVQETK